MPTRTVSLTAEQDVFIKDAVNAGEYQDASEVVHDAIRALQQRGREDELKLQVLRVQIRVGLESGQFTEVAGDDLDIHLEVLGAKGRNHAR